MFVQLALGTTLLLASIFVAGLSFWAMEGMTVRMHPWLTREPHRIKLMLVLCIAAVWVMVQMTIGVWIWALTLRGLGVFDAMEPAVYFSLVAFTTLGFGDILLPMEWRLLGGLAAANGLLNIGMVTALLVEALRQVRLQQLAVRKPKH
ncbi:two pore domain potassium channel family protein [Loktanella sp. D2R18]|uniref:ion channel n=1 Tax=Rhodobacterales TaxID=204455 RepID=UPI000DEA859F|nr:MULTISPECIES: ion channel [Rhodobacterales]MDO6590774.1 ion channel [Yoonia sp. 1_MG-2023]RBW43371.1 two pore domain potassium channel family protein [Loktanella sp. D2R18]